MGIRPGASLTKTWRKHEGGISGIFTQRILWYNNFFSFVLPVLVSLMQTLFHSPRQSHFQSPWGCDVVWRRFSLWSGELRGIGNAWQSWDWIKFKWLHSERVFQLRNEAFERLSGCTWKIPSSTDYGDACSGIREQWGLLNFRITEVNQRDLFILWTPCDTVTMHHAWDNLMFGTGNCAGKTALSRAGAQIWFWLDWSLLCFSHLCSADADWSLFIAT